MSLTVLAAYIVTCVLLAVTPGPNMALNISATLAGGLGAGLATVAGCFLGLAILATIAAVGMTSVMILMAEWFDVVRWVGAVYLIFLGLRQLWGWWRTRRATGSLAMPARAVPGHSRFVQGLLVSLSNPKTLLFLGAFFPQFVSADAPPGPQLALLAGLFVVTLALVDIATAVLVARARATVDMRRLRALDAASGVLLVAGGLVLATARRP